MRERKLVTVLFADLANYTSISESILKEIGVSKEVKIKPNYSHGHLFLSELYLSTGQNEKAMENLKKAEGMFRKMGMDYWLNRTQEVLKTV